MSHFLFRSFTIVALLFSFFGCNGSDNGYQRAANRFVRSLNIADSGLFSSYDSELILYTNETERSLVSGEGDWFVIYDDRRDRYTAVRIGYLRGLAGYSFEEYFGELGDSYRGNEGFNRLFGNTDGDSGGDNYEAVDLASDGYFYGRESGYAYEDEDFVSDVNLLVAIAQEKRFYQRVANISYAHSIAPASAARLLVLGKKVEAMQSRGGQQLSAADSKIVLKELEGLSGVSQEELLKLSSDSREKGRILQKISTHIGTTAQNLEDHILPELFGLSL